MTRLICIDPGPTHSGYVELDLDTPWPHLLVGGEAFAHLPNTELLNALQPGVPTVIERIASYGMPVGEEVFETVRQAAFMEAAVGSDYVSRVTRHQVKMALCHTGKANDAVIRQRLLDIYGGKEQAVGTKKAPGPLYQVKGDAWAALAVGLAHLLMEGSGE